MTTIEPLSDLSDPTFDPYAGEAMMFGDLTDPYPLLKASRLRAGVIAGSFREALGLDDMPMPNYESRYALLSYAAVEQALSHPEIFSNHSFASTLGMSFGHTVTLMDPPEHTRYRKILQKAFHPNIVQQWGDGIVGPVIDQLVSVFRKTGRAELVGEFARPYSFNVIYRMLDLPQEDIDVFFKLTLTQIITWPTPDMAIEASEKLGRYFGAMIAERRADPRGDLVSHLATTEVDGEWLPEDVLVSFLRQLINAGGDTTFRTTTVLFTGLLNNPDQLEAVRRDRSLVSSAIEEALRFDGPVLCSSRETVADAVIEGVPIPKGAFLDVVYGAANHDPAVFENPDKFDIFRAKHRHFGFAFGVHNCLGQQLARLEMTRALNAVLDELPNVRLDPDSQAPQLLGTMMRTPKEIRVMFD